MSARLKPGYLCPTGYKQTEVGVIPEEWAVKQLKKISPAQSVGLVINPSTYVEDDGTVPMLVGSNIKANSINWDNARRISDASNKSLPASRLNAGDLVTVRVGEPGTTAVVPPELDGCNCASVMIVRKHQSFDSHWLCYVMSSRTGIAQIENVQYGTAQKQFNISDAINFIYATPPLSEQQAIAEALSDADSLIDSLEQLIAKKRHIKQGAMQELLTGKKRLPGFSGEWEMKRLGDVADSNQKWSFTGGPFGSNLKSSDYVDDGVRIIQLQNIGDGEFHNDSAVFTSQEKADELLSCNIYPGEIILSKMGDPVARACIIPSYHERYLMCSDGIRLAVNPKRFNTFFVYISINAPDFRTRAENAGTGSTRKRIGLTELRNLELLCPGLPEQTAIAAILSDMDAEIAALETQLTKTRSLKLGMMRNLLTGRIRLL